MYRGKFEAPRGTNKPRHIPPTRRIEDVPLSAAPQANSKPVAPVAAPMPKQAPVRQPVVNQTPMQPSVVLPPVAQVPVNRVAPVQPPVVQPPITQAPASQVAPAMPEPNLETPASQAASSPPVIPETPAQAPARRMPSMLSMVSNDPTADEPAGPMQPMQGTGHLPPIPKKQAPTSPARASAQTTVRKNTAKKKRRTTKGTKIFYTVYAVVILLFFALVAGVLSGFNGLLKDYEDAQPKYKCQQTFDQYIAKADWGDLYDIANHAKEANVQVKLEGNVSTSSFDSKEDFVQYMTEKAGGQALRYVATASGDPERLSKYIIKAGDTNIGTFTLQATGRYDYGSGAVAEFLNVLLPITYWEPGTISLPIQYDHSVSVCVGAGQTAYVNGVALTEDQILKTTVTLAEDYLPEGLHGHSTTTYYVDGLLMKPTVEVRDAQGNVVSTAYDAEKNLYTATFEKSNLTISEKEKTTLIQAAKVLSEYRIEVRDHTSLARYFDSSSAYYKATVKQDTWMQTTMYKSHRFSDPVVSEYYVYSDNLISAHVDMTLFVTRNNGTVKEWNAGGTFFMTKRSDGTWIVTDANNMRLQEEKTMVRLRYMVNGQELTHELVDSTSVQLEPPIVDVPEGKEFAGWYYETVDAEGKPMLALAFKPDPATGLAYLGNGVHLEPMVLHARFEDKGAQ